VSSKADDMANVV